MQKYKSNIITTSGAAVRNVPVTVLKEDGTLASLFLDRDGHVAAPNPLKTGPDGTFYFYAVNGRYGLRTTVDGVTITDDDVVLQADPEELAQSGPIAEAIAAAVTAAETAEANAAAAASSAASAESKATAAEAAAATARNDTAAALALVDGFRNYRTVSTSAPSGIPRQGEEWIVVN